ncbi:MAG: response regulator [Treponema sp.]|nr:response regulator [Treponema sp.]
MKIIALDDEYLGLEGLTKAIKESVPSATLHAFQDCDKALEDIKSFIPDIAFLDIELRTKNGIEVAQILKEKNPKINIIFVTGYSDYMKEAFALYASGYVLKPVIPENIKKELEHLRFPLPQKKRIYFHTFGSFEVFGDGKPLSFAYTKSKEMLAALIDSNGIPLTLGKIEELLWENVYHDRRPYIRNLIADIRKVFRKFDSEDIIIRSHNSIALDITKIDCDYYDYLAGKSEALDSFQNEYMNQYSWAEVTLAKLLEK